MRFLPALVIALALSFSASWLSAQAVSGPPSTLVRRISVGTTEDELQIKATAGVLVSISAWNKNASADAFLKCTNATAANTTPGTTTVFYSMLIPFGIGFIDNVNATFDTALTCYIVLSKEDTAVDEVAANEVSYNLRYR